MSMISLHENDQFENTYMMHFIGKTERLARNLLDVYGLNVADASSFDLLVKRTTPWNLVVWPRQFEFKALKHMFNIRCVYGCSSWENMLFGTGGEASLNQFLEMMPAGFVGFNDFLKTKIKSSIIPFSTLDELDIQLTLAGANKNFFKLSN